MRTRLALAVVRLSCRLLPPQVAGRYAAELTAELQDLAPGAGLAHACRFALRTPALRRATRGGPAPEFASPWRCRVRLHHRYALAVTEDGGRYLRCRVCGRDDPTPWRVNDGQAWAGASYASNW